MLFVRARDTRLYPFVVLAAATGCRRGELLALQWTDVDLHTGLLTVSKSLEQTKAAGLRVKSTKSEEPRQLGVPDWAIEVLDEHRTEQDRDRALFGKTYNENNLIFCQPDGNYYSPDRLGARVVELMRKVGLQGVSLHSLRHSHASILLSKGFRRPSCRSAWATPTRTSRFRSTATRCRRTPGLPRRSGTTQWLKSSQVHAAWDGLLLEYPSRPCGSARSRICTPAKFLGSMHGRRPFQAGTSMKASRARWISASTSL